MADTISTCTVPTTWASFDEITDGAITTGMACLMQNQSVESVETFISPTRPDESLQGWFTPPDYAHILEIDAGENTVWARSVSKATVSIQKDDDAGAANGDDV